VPLYEQSSVLWLEDGSNLAEDIREAEPQVIICVVGSDYRHFWFL
jgi:hypothetical protein